MGGGEVEGWGWMVEYVLEDMLAEVQGGLFGHGFYVPSGPETVKDARIRH